MKQMKNAARFAAAILAALLTFASCAQPGTADPAPTGSLSAGVAAVTLPAAAKDPTGAPADAEITDAVTDFSERFYKLAAKENAGKNTILSPLSLYYALSLTANGALGETKAEFEDALGMPADELNEYLYTLTGKLAESAESKVRTANSVWVNDRAFWLSPDFKAVAEKYYAAETDRVPFDKASCERINRWVSEKTDGMIDHLLDELDPAAVMILLNTVLFDGIWEEEYEEEAVRPGTFTAADGTEKTVDFLHSTEYSYFETEGGKGFSKSYKDGYRFIGVRPDGDVNDFIASMDLAALIRDSGESTLKADCAIPKFEYETTLDLNDITKALGIQRAFTGEAELDGLAAADDSGIDWNIFISDILQKAKVILNEHGTKAAAVTEIVFKNTAFMPEIRREVILDKPFFYVIADSDGIPLFLGTVTDPTAK